MGRLKRAATVVVMVLGALLVLANARGVVTGVWIPTGPLVFSGIILGVVCAILDAVLLGDKHAQASAPAGMPAVVRTEPARTAVVFRQQIPPGHDPRHLSYFGGLPTVSPSFVWPTWTHDGVTEPLHFVMQIDCAAVPSSARHDGFPPHGVLYVFLDLRWAHSNGYRVLYAEAVTEPLAPAPAPAGLAVAYGPEARYAWRWTKALDDPAARCPKLLPKWPFDPVSISIPAEIIETWRSEIDQEQENPVFYWPESGAMGQVLLDAQEQRRASAPAIAAGPEPAPMTRPYAAYPQDWRAIEIGAALLLGHMNHELRYAKTNYRLRLMTPEDVQAMSGRIGLEARQWLAQAAGHAPFEATSAQTRDAFWSWLESWRDFSQLVIKQAATRSVEAALAESAEAAARIPGEAVARIHAGHALATRTESGIFAATPDRMLAPPSYVQGNQEETAQTHLLLLELSSNDGIGHYFGEGVYQFWIAPADLRARRFDRVVLTTDAY
jgi:hypothetical protein